MRQCDICGKRAMSGKNVSHSHRKTNRVFLPNLQYKRILIDNEYKRARICTQCLKTLNKVGKA